MSMKFSDLRQAARANRVSVHLHAWRQMPDGSQEYTDDAVLANGWATYIRIETPDDPQQPFDTTHEADHTTMRDALARARGQAFGLLGDVNAFNHD